MTHAAFLAEPVERLGDALLFRGVGVQDLNYLLPRAVLDAARRDGIAVPARWRQTLEIVREAAAMSACPATDVRERTDRSQWCTSAEAAEILGVGERQIRRLAKGFGGYRGRGGWLLPLAEVQAEAQRRATT